MNATSVKNLTFGRLAPWLEVGLYAALCAAFIGRVLLNPTPIHGVDATLVLVGAALGVLALCRAPWGEGRRHMSGDGLSGMVTDARHRVAMTSLSTGQNASNDHRTQHAA